MGSTDQNFAIDYWYNLNKPNLVHKIVVQVKLAWLNIYMSGEQISIDRSVVSRKKVTFESERTTPKTSNRVNINHLMSKVRDEEKKQRKEKISSFDNFKTFKFQKYSHYLEIIVKFKVLVIKIENFFILNKRSSVI